jgi:tRNA (guanine-N(7)-)-methyltransferase subunit TRM82
VSHVLLSSQGLVFADKAGEVLLLPTPTLAGPARLLLGHVSIITDLALSPSEKHLFTADRDEKVRVSRFPFAAQIDAFCLGHTEYVTRVALLGGSSDWMVSGSGDGSLRLWHWPTGALLHTVPPAAGESAAVTPTAFFPASRTLAVLVESANKCALQLYRISYDPIQFAPGPRIEQPSIEDATFDSKGTLWLMASNLLHAYTPEGTPLSVPWLSIVNNPALIPTEKPEKGPQMLKKRFAEEAHTEKEKEKSRRVPAYVKKATQQTT